MKKLKDRIQIQKNHMNKFRVEQKIFRFLTSMHLKAGEQSLDSSTSSGCVAKTVVLQKLTIINFPLGLGCRKPGLLPLAVGFNTYAAKAQSSPRSQLMAFFFCSMIDLLLFIQSTTV